VRVTVLLGLATAAVPGCGPPPADPPPPNGFAFGVFGDGPYHAWERGRFEAVLADLDRADVAWLLHVGDILDGPCSDDAYRERLAQLNALRHPVIYTPGDNEWTDCHEARNGGYAPLERLAALRDVFFATPGRSLGGVSVPLVSQADDPAFAEFPENVRWTFGGFVFATVHVVGSDNGWERYPDRPPDADAEVRRRTSAALAWIDAAFAEAVASSARGVVLALHADMGLGPVRAVRGHQPFVAAIERHTVAFTGPVLLIHGDTHQYRVDHPLTDSSGRPYPNFTRLETFGSPDIGWVRVVVDTVAGAFAGYEPRRMGGFW
jgi:hypothetical protein